MGKAGEVMVIAKNLLCNRRGTAALEFAMIAPFLAATVVGMSDLAMGLTRKYQIEQAGYRALEMMTVGTFQSNYDTYIKPEVAAAADVPEANVSVTTLLECGGVASDFTQPCADSDVEEARYITVTITDDYEPSFSYIADLLGGANGKIPLTARSTLRVK